MNVYALNAVQVHVDSPSLVADVSDYVGPANRILWYCPNGQDVCRVIELPVGLYQAVTIAHD